MTGSTSDYMDYGQFDQTSVTGNRCGEKGERKITEGVKRHEKSRVSLDWIE